MTCSTPSSPRPAAMNSGSHLLSYVSKCARANVNFFCTTSKMERDVDFLIALFTGEVIVTDAVVDTFLSLGKAV